MPIIELRKQSFPDPLTPQLYGDVVIPDVAWDTIGGLGTPESNANVTGDHIFLEATAPTTGAKEGDIWYDSANNNHPYKFINGAWVSIQDTGAAAGPDIGQWAHSLAFSATDYNTIAWDAGTIKLKSGTTYSILAGNTGDIAAITYIFLDTTVSSTVLQTTTTATNAVGTNRILVAVAKQNSDTAKKAEFQVFGGFGQSTFITTDNLAANAVTANEITANTITANKLSISTLSAIAADLGTITAGTIGAGTAIIGGFSIGADYIRDNANSFGFASTASASGSFASRAVNLNGTTGLTMIQNANADDANIAVTLPFAVIFNNISYTTVYVGSNGYLTFGAGSSLFTALSASIPAIPGIHINAGDRSYQRVYKGSTDGNATYIVRYEGTSTTGGTPGSSTVFWEVKFTAASPSTFKIDMGSNAASGTGTSGVTSGAAYLQTFTAGTVNIGYDLTFATDPVRHWGGDTFDNRANADFWIKESGAAKFSVITLTGLQSGSDVDGQYLTANSVASSASKLALRGWTQTCAFSVTDADTIAWGSGTFTASNGTSYSIGAGNTGNMAAKTYIYLDISVSTTAFQTTTTATTAIGDNKVLVAIAQNGTTEATYMLLNNNSYNIDAANIVAGSITANEIAASTITAAKLTITTLSSITADLGSITAGTITGGIFQTSASATVGIKFDSTSFRGYNASNTITFEISPSTGTVTASKIVLTGLQAGSSVDATYVTGALSSTVLNLADRGWTQTCAFSVSDADTVAWGAGSFVASDGTTYSIGSGNTGNMVARSYIYLDIAVSTIAYQVTTTASTAVGAGKVLIATAINGTVEPEFEVFGGIGGSNINASQIVAGSLTANEIAASTITAGKLTISQLSAIAADLGTITAGTITGGTFQTSASATVGIKFDSTSLRGYNASNTVTFELNPSTGTLTIGKVVLTGLQAGSSLDGSYLASASVASAAANLSLRGWTQTSVFSITDADTVAWGSGTFTASDGTAYSIGAGNTGNMAARTYIYLDIAVSTTAYQVTTTAATAVGNGKVLIATAINNTTEATFQVFGGLGGLNVDGTSIVTGSITANEMAAGSITAGKISVSTLSAISADLGTITAGTVTGATIQTASSGARVVFNSTGIKGYDATTQRYELLNDGSGWLGAATTFSWTTAGVVTAGGFTFSASTLANGTNIILDGTNKKISINSATFGSDGIQLDYNAGDPRFYVGNGSDQYAKFDGTTFSSSGTVIPLESFTAGENITANKAVYVKASDGKVYHTDAGFDTEKLYSFIGFAAETKTTGNAVKIQSSLAMSGFTGLVAGTKYNLAKAGTSAQTETGGNTGTGTPLSIGGASNGLYARKFTTTDKGLFQSFSLRVHKSGTLANNLICQLRTGTPSGATIPFGSLLASVTVAATSFSSGDTVVFDFSDTVLGAGTYHLYLYHDVPETEVFQVKSDATSTSAYSVSGGVWTNGQVDTPYTITFDGSAFVAGDISYWYYDYAQEVGTALTTTSFRIFKEKTLGSWNTIALTSGEAAGIADRDGIFYYKIDGGATSGNITLQSPIGTTRVISYSQSGPISASTASMFVRKYDSWKVSGPSSGTTCWFVPFN